MSSFFINNVDFSCIIYFHRLLSVSSCLICLDESLDSPFFSVKTWTIHFIDCFFAHSTFGWGREMLYDFLVDAVNSPMLKSSSFSQARTPICAASMSVEMHTPLKRFFYEMWFPQFREIMKHINFHHHASAIVLFVTTLSNFH